MTKQLHKRFSTKEVKMLLEKYPFPPSSTGLKEKASIKQKRKKRKPMTVRFQLSI